MSIDAKALQNQAKELYQTGEMNQAIATFEQARAAYVEQGNPAGAASATNDLGVVYYLTGKRDQAMQLLRDALAAYETLGDVAGQAKATGNLAQLMSRAQDYENAEKNYLRASELFHQLGDKRLEYDTYRALSQMQLQRGRWLEALNAFDRALAAKGGWKLLRWFFQIPLRLAGVR
jgi:tetratricopeptide (TPR) repeat protein